MNKSSDESSKELPKANKSEMSVKNFGKMMNRMESRQKGRSADLFLYERKFLLLFGVNFHF